MEQSTTGTSSPAASTPRSTDLHAEVATAARRLRDHDLRTPTIPARSLGPQVSVKCENLQRTGSFKIRGALNKLLALSPSTRARGVVASSTGNHGLAVANALAAVGGQGTVVVSSSAAPHKIARLERAGLRVVVHEGESLDAELAARRMADDGSLEYISPYNDRDVVAGQGTVGVELLEQLPDVEAVYIAVGGGGLVSGIAAYLKAERPAIRIIGCWPKNAPAMHASIEAGHIIDVAEDPTLSDGTAGNVEPGSITFPLCRDLIDERVLVTEAAIARAMRDVLLDEHLVIEGAAGVAVAGWRQLATERSDYERLTSAIVLCGGNVGSDTLARVLVQTA